MKDAARTAYNLLFRVLQDRGQAKKLLGELGPFEGLGLEELIHWCRDLVKSKLDDEGWAKSAFARAPEILAQTPEVPSLITRLGTLDDQIPDKELKERLGPGTLLFVELCLVERGSPEMLARAFEVSEALVLGHLSHLVDALGELTALEHGEGCPHPSQAIAAALREHVTDVTEGAPAPAAATAAVSGCAGCATGRDRVGGILKLLSRDSRILSLGTSDHFEKVKEGPRVRPTAKIALPPGADRSTGRIPLPPLPLPDRPTLKDRLPQFEEKSRWSRFWPFFLLAGAALVSMLLLRQHDLASSSSPAVGGEDARAIGFFAERTRPAARILPGTTLESPADAPAQLDLFRGVALRLDPGTKLEAHETSVKLIEGRVDLATPRAQKPAFRLEAGTIILELERAHLEAAVAGGKTKVHVLEGECRQVAPAPGRSLGAGDRID